MNQILVTKNEIHKKKYFLIFQLIISIIVIIAIIYFISFHFYNISRQEKLSNQIMNNYNLSKLYANISNDESLENSENSNNLFGIIEIPIINLSYPVFNTLTEELLKISPCKFYGNNLDENGNICIAGHNYDNGKFFSNIYMLEPDDKIYIYSNDKKYTYLVSSNYEVEANDLSPIFNYDNSRKNLTLVTCNNLTGDRIIIVANRQ